MTESDDPRLIYLRNTLESLYPWGWYISPISPMSDMFQNAVHNGITMDASDSYLDDNNMHITCYFSVKHEKFINKSQVGPSKKLDMQDHKQIVDVLKSTIDIAVAKERRAQNDE